MCYSSGKETQIMKSGGLFTYAARHKFFFWVVALALFCQFAVPCAFSAEPQQLERKGVALTRVVAAARYPYLVITPTNFQDRTLRWPLIVFLHGGDQSGSDLNLVKANGPPRYALSHSDFPFVVVAPQLPAGHLWEPAAVVGVVKQVVSRFRIDAGQVYLTGLSTGGYGTWKTALQYPERFAAVAPVAGGGSTEILKHAEGQQLQFLRTLPIWAFHGGSDGLIAPNESERMVSEFQAIGNPAARVTIFPGAPHDIWNNVYDDPAFYQWLLQYRR
jgi:predicted peptidase